VEVKLTTAAQLWAHEIVGVYAALCGYHMVVLETSWRAAVVDSIGVTIACSLGVFAVGAIRGFRDAFRGLRRERRGRTGYSMVQEELERLSDERLEQDRAMALVRLKTFTGAYGVRYAAEFFFGLHLDGEPVTVAVIDEVFDDVSGDLESDIGRLLTSQEAAELRARFEEGFIKATAVLENAEAARRAS
jgi:hypothetical protein